MLIEPFFSKIRLGKYLKQLTRNHNRLCSTTTHPSPACLQIPATANDHIGKGNVFPSN